MRAQTKQRWESEHENTDKSARSVFGRDFAVAKLPGRVGYLPGPALPRVEQGRVAEERREHALNPAGLSKAVVLLLRLLILRPT